MQRAEIIAVGTELLMGQVVNTNTTDIARLLNELSISVYYQSVVGDNAERLKEQLALASQRSQLIILCGGIGPTQDDITKHVLAEFLNLSLDYHQPTEEKLRTYYKTRQRIMPENNLRQALYFKEGKALYNHNGMAVGVMLIQDDVTYIVLPGPPHELRLMLEKEVKPLLVQQKNIIFHSQTLRFFGIGESALAEKIDDLVTSQNNPTIAIYASETEVSVRLTANGDSIEQCEQFIQPIVCQINARLSEYLYGYGDDKLAKIVVDLLRKEGLTISVAESLTGGWFQKAIVDISGASSTFKGGIVTYQTTMKSHLLHIDDTLLQKYGTVSKECAIAMAEAIQHLCQSDIGIAFTGVAEGTIEAKKEGTVFFAIAKKGLSTKWFQLALTKERNANRYLAVQHGLNELRKLLEDRHGN